MIIIICVILAFVKVVCFVYLEGCFFCILVSV